MGFEERDTSNAETTYPKHIRFAEAVPLTRLIRKHNPFWDAVFLRLQFASFLPIHSQIIENRKEKEEENRTLR